MLSPIIKLPSMIKLLGVELSLGRGAARVHILRGISLEVGQGEAVGLVGPSGSGKSSLLMAMAGLERIDAGAVEIDGQDLAKLDEDDLAEFRGRRIGIVFHRNAEFRILTQCSHGIAAVPPRKEFHIANIAIDRIYRARTPDADAG